MWNIVLWKLEQSNSMYAYQDGEKRHTIKKPFYVLEC